MNKKISYFGAGIGMGIYLGVYLFLFLIPCLVDPTDCSGRDIGIFVLSLPASNLIELLPYSVNIQWQMFFVFVTGIAQYGIIFAVLANLIVKVAGYLKKHKK